MSVLFLQTASQAIQAFLPVAAAFAWFRRCGMRDAARAIWVGALAGLGLTPVAGFFFRHVDRQAQLEASLAWSAMAAALLAVVAFRRTAGGGVLRRRLPAIPVALSLLAVILVLRQSMEIAVLIWVAAIEVRSQAATLAASGGVALGVAIAAGCATAIALFTPRAAARTSFVLAALYAAQAALYAFHESAESLWLPWSDALHAATEPYGPDGVYGPLGSLLVAMVPVAAGAASLVGRRTRRVGTAGSLRFDARAVVAPLVALAMLALSAASVARMNGRAHTTSEVLAAASGGSAGTSDAAVSVGTGGLLFRHTNIEGDYGHLAVAMPGASPGARAIASLSCERVAFGGDRGLCLQAARGFFTTYRAVLFDRSLRAIRTLPLGGGPSRTRVSADGRVGAITVFSTATHNYAATSFSTETTLVDMATGDLLGDLEEFATWRDGVRIKAADFNFWGVTFGRDPTVFYATLRTGGRTYLMRGDLGLRKLTVLRENVECPSLSPNNRLLAFKKRVGPAADPWRLYVLDLTTMEERAVSAETRSIDDQVEWLDDEHLLYGVPRHASPAVRDVWVAPLDGRTPARVFLPEAESAIVIR